MKPIPKTLLIHSAKLLEVTEEAWQEKNEKEIAALKNVRVEPAGKMIVTNDNRSITLSAVLFYDCRNSSPKTEIKCGNYIVFEGQRYRVETVERLYDNKRLHHLEVGLCL